MGLHLHSGRGRRAGQDRRLLRHSCVSPQPHLGVVELHGVIGRERDVQSLVQEFPKWVLGIFQKQAVVAERRHGNRDLSKVVEILQNRTLQKNQQTLVGRVPGPSGVLIPMEAGGWAVSRQVSAKPEKAGLSRATFLYCLHSTHWLRHVGTHTYCLYSLLASDCRV